MSGKRDSDVKDVQAIVERIGLLVGDTASRAGTVGEIPEALTCLRLWFAIRTDEGRERALDCLSRIVEDEQR